MANLFYPDKKRRENYAKTKAGKYYSDYSRYRQEIREDGLFRCAYCDIHEDENGGEEHMNLDHLRPKVLPQFLALVNDPNNLVWVCAGCNRLKAYHWPVKDNKLTYDGNEGFVDPFAESYMTYFSISDAGVLMPVKAPAQYMIMVLALNRESRRRVRELRLIKNQIVSEFNLKIDELIDWKRSIISDPKIDATLKQAEVARIDQMISWLLATGERIKGFLIS